MSEQIREVATRFVDVVLRYDWNNIEGGLKDRDEIQTLFDIVNIAGFCPTRVVLGRVMGYEGFRFGCMLNRPAILCPYKVVGKDDHVDEDNIPASIWLNTMFGSIIYSDKKAEDARNQLISTIIKEVEDVIPLEPIQITLDGDFLDVPLGQGFKRPRDNDEFGLCIGTHQFCGGSINRGRATHTHDVIVCGRCYLRILIPREIETYGDLRRALAPKSK